MTINIAIIGLGQIGASIGLALLDQKEYFLRIGHDKDFGISQQAKKMGAVDHIERNLINAVKDANVVILSIPIDQIHETMKLIAPELKNSTIIMDTASIKTPILEWANELVPEGRYYVGITPVINPAYLQDSVKGIKGAHKDLFQHGLLMIVANPKTHPDALKFTSDFSLLLGAEPFFTDPAEADGFMATTHILPQLTSAALINATMDTPGWQDARKIAGLAYTKATEPMDLLDDVAALQESSSLNKDNMVRVLDDTIASLKTIRDLIYQENFDELQDFLNQASQSHIRWWQDRQSKSLKHYDKTSSDEIPASRGIISSLFGMGGAKKTKK